MCPFPLAPSPHPRYLALPLRPTLTPPMQGIYLLSTLIQLRTSFPPPRAAPDTTPAAGAGANLFATLPEYQFFGALFDGAFLLAAGVAAGARWFGERMIE